MSAFDRNLEALGGCNGQDETFVCSGGCGREVDELGQICDACRAYDGRFLSSLIGAVERAENKAKGAA